MCKKLRLKRTYVYERKMCRHVSKHGYVSERNFLHNRPLKCHCSYLFPFCETYLPPQNVPIGRYVSKQTILCNRPQQCPKILLACPIESISAPGPADADALRLPGMCEWFTFHPSDGLCVLYERCEIDIDSCPSCVSGKALIGSGRFES